jgi:hypothetical protein
MSNEAIKPIPADDKLEAMRRDAARYEWLRENWLRIATHTSFSNGVTYVHSVEVWSSAQDCPTHRPFDQQSLDHAIDAQIAREADAARKTSDAPRPVADAIARFVFEVLEEPVPRAPEQRARLTRRLYELLDDAR